MDLFQLNGKSYLIVVDYNSRWIETVHLKQTTSVAVMEHCKSIFAKFGIPELVLSDNGPQFSSREFLKFSPRLLFHSYYQYIILKEMVKQRNTLKKSTDPYIALLNYRTTPLLHGYSPAELMMSRKLRNCVPTILSQHIPFKPEVEEFKKKDEHQKSAEVLP